MFTLFSIPKPFAGHIGVIQRNAVRSWKALGTDVQVVLIGDDEGVEESAAGLGVEHVGGLAHNDRGTPRIDDAFSKVDGRAQHTLRCFVHTDIILLPDFLIAVAYVAAHSSCLAIGQSANVHVETELDFADQEAITDLRQQARRDGVLRGASALDYFVFRSGHFGPIPPFLIGRTVFDNWLVWRGRQQGPVVDATAVTMPIHQHHDYSHMAGGQHEAFYGAEAAENLRLAGGKSRIFTLHDATHRLHADGSLSRNLGSYLHARETLRRTGAKIDRELRRRGFRGDRPGQHS